MKKRLKVFQEKGMNSPEYLDRLNNDVCGIHIMEETPTKEVLAVANVSELCLEASIQEHVGDENEITLEFVKNHMEVLYFYPIKNKQSFSNKEEALTIYVEAMGAAMTRFEKPDTPGKFNSVISFIKCLD